MITIHTCSYLTEILYKMFFDKNESEIKICAFFAILLYILISYRTTY